MIKLWEMFFNFCKFMIHMLTENDSDEDGNTAPLYIKHVVYELLLSSVYFLQKTEFKLESINHRINKNSSTDSIIENLLSSKMTSKPVDFLCFQGQNLFSFAVQNSSHPNEAVKKYSNDIAVFSGSAEENGEEEMVCYSKESALSLQEDEVKKGCSINKEVGSFYENNGEKEVNNTDGCSVDTVGLLDSCENTTQMEEEIYENTSMDLFSHSAPFHSANDEFAGIKVLAEECNEVEELKLNVDEINLTLVEGLGEKIVVEKKSFDKNFKCFPYEDISEDVFSEIKLVWSEFVKAPEGLQLINDENDPYSRDEDVGLLVRSVTYHELLNENSSIYSAFCHKSNEGEKMFLPPSIIDKEGSIQYFEGTTGSNILEIALSSNAPESASDVKKTDEEEDEEIVQLDIINRKEPFIEYKDDRISNDLVEKVNQANYVVADIQENKDAENLNIDPEYNKSGGNNITNKSFHEGYFCHLCNQVFFEKTQWKSHCTSSFLHNYQKALLKSKIITKECSLCKFALIATELVAEEHMIFHRMYHNELGDQNVNLKGLEHIDLSNPDKSETIQIKESFKLDLKISNADGNISKSLDKRKLLDAQCQDVPSSSQLVNSRDKQSNSVEELKKITDFLFESDDDVPEEIHSSTVNSNYQDCRTARYIPSNKFSLENEKRRICISKHFKAINRAIRTHQISDAFYCRPCDISFISAYKWKDHCSNCRLHQYLMKSQESENFEVKCKHCNLHAILSLNFIEPYMKCHLRVHKIYNEAYRITSNSSEQIHYTILTDNMEKLKEICKEHLTIQRSLINSDLQRSEEKINKVRKEVKGINVETNILRQDELRNPVHSINFIQRQSKNNLIDVNQGSDNNFADISDSVESANAECKTKFAASLITKESICSCHEAGPCSVCGDKKQSKRCETVDVDTDIWSFVRKIFIERNKKVTNMYFPLFLGICLFCKNSFKTPLEWSHHLQEEKHLPLTAKGVSVSCFKCALIIYGDPDTYNVDESLFLSEHHCFI